MSEKLHKAAWFAVVLARNVLAFLAGTWIGHHVHITIT